jgi:WD40 repeat protein
LHYLPVNDDFCGQLPGSRLSADRWVKPRADLHIAWNPDGTRLAKASWDNTRRLWDDNTGTELRIFDQQQGAIVVALFSPHGQRLPTASADGSFMIFDYRAAGDDPHPIHALLFQSGRQREPLRSLGAEAKEKRVGYR